MYIPTLMGAIAISYIGEGKPNCIRGGIKKEAL
jgi:hypothetical protein